MPVRVQHLAGSSRFDLAAPQNEGSGVYLTHNNGGRPFRVKVTPREVVITDNYNGQTLDVIQEYARIFIGESPLTNVTSLGGGHGPEFRGNSVLIEKCPQEYVFVGDRIFSFVTTSPIDFFLSEVGNNDVPYPYAIDRSGRFYLFAELVVIHAPQYLNPGDDPYGALYAVPQKRYQEILGIKYLVGKNKNEMFRLRFDVDPHGLHEKDWMSDLHAVRMDGSMEVISDQEYVDMMEKVNQALGICALKTTLPGVPTVGFVD